MKICICKNKSTNDFKETLKQFEGVSIGLDDESVETFHTACSGDGSQCGCCFDTIREDFIQPHNKIVQQVQEMAESTDADTNVPSEPA